MSAIGRSETGVESRPEIRAPAVRPLVDTTDWPSPPVSIVILTLNEQENIDECLASCAWSDDVHVLDSGSTDETRAIAERRGAGVHVNPFESFGKQRNWAIDNISMRYEWIFHLDADERFTRELVEEIDALLRRDPREAGFYVPSKLMFMGRWLKRSGAYPAYQMRLFHAERMRFTDYGHGQREQTEGEIGRLRSGYLHYNFSKGLEEWFDKHNRYSTQEAEQAMREAGLPLGRALAGVFSRDPLARRRAVKSIGYRLPGRSLLWIFYLLVLRLGVLDGPAGWNYARLRAVYESMIAAKLAALQAERRLRRSRNGSDGN